jgi:hypothetical protein
MKVIDLEFQILCIQLDSPILSPIFYYTIQNLKFKIPFKFDYKQSNSLFWVRIWRFFCCKNGWPCFCEATFELKSMQIWLGQNFTYSMLVVLVKHRFYEYQIQLLNRIITSLRTSKCFFTVKGLTKEGVLEGRKMSLTWNGLVSPLVVK